MFFVSAAGILLTVSAVSVLAYIFPMFAMHPLASGTIEGTDITAIKNRINNLFFIPSDEGWIVIDAGSDARSANQEMEKRSIEGDKVKGVFLTHTDYDHVASLVLFPDAAIYMSEREKQFTGDAFKEENGQILIHPYTMDRKTAQETIHDMKDELKKYEKVFTAHYGFIGNDKK